MMSDSRWKPGQVAELVEGFWRGRPQQCPDDGSILAENFNDSFSDGYVLILTCPRCGKKATSQRGRDPRAAEFRDWTEAEKADVIDRHFGGGPDCCPVDGAALRSIQGPGGALTRLQCPRCGRWATHALERS